ncbi:MAG: ParB/RepB/Spo0J family partition protein, partial [Natronosporangium sp.]
MRIANLVLDGSPRLHGEDVSHTRLLAQTHASLPPILVHWPTMRVVDGVHRVQAARLRGETSIRAVFFDGDENAAFVKAVEANVSHGLPLSIDDRRVAAARIIALYPDWSDRAVAASAGLSP